MKLGNRLKLTPPERVRHLRREAETGPMTERDPGSGRAVEQSPLDDKSTTRAPLGPVHAASVRKEKGE